MNRSFYLLPCLLLVLFSACSGESEKDAPEKSGPGDSLKQEQASTTETEDAYEPAVAIEIGRKKLHPGRVELQAPFVADSALKAIFPGKYTEVEGNDEMYQVVWWKCDQCERIPLFYNYFIEPESQGSFPDSAFNTSIVLEQKKLTLNGESYELVTFFHTALTAPEFYGRFSGAPTGAALFRKKGDTYTMENFSPVLGCFGSYSTPIGAGLIRVGKEKIILDYTFGNGGAGSEYTAVKEMFMAENGGFRKILFDRFLSCSNTCMGEWSSSMSVTDSLTTQGLSDLVIVTEGFADGSCMDEEQLHYFNTAPEELKAKARSAMEKKEKFNFSVTRTFRYNGKEYTCVESATSFPAQLSKK